MTDTNLDLSVLDQYKSYGQHVRHGITIPFSDAIEVMQAQPGFDYQAMEKTLQLLEQNLGINFHYRKKAHSILEKPWNAIKADGVRLFFNVSEIHGHSAINIRGPESMYGYPSFDGQMPVGSIPYLLLPYQNLISTNARALAREKEMVFMHSMSRPGYSFFSLEDIADKEDFEVRVKRSVDICRIFDNYLQNFAGLLDVEKKPGILAINTQ